MLATARRFLGIIDRFTDRCGQVGIGMPVSGCRQLLEPLALVIVQVMG